MTSEKISSYIDHTLLAPNAVRKQVELLCQEALKYKFASVCVNPYYVSFCSEILKESDVKVCTVIGFPLGANTTDDKVSESVNAVKNGADEVDMVINIGAAINNEFSLVGEEISKVVDASKTAGKELNKKICVKVILETCFLSDSQIVECCKEAKKAGADFVKTSTGFANPKGLDGKPLSNGASEHHVALMRETVGSDMGVKASGGIRSARTAIAMLEAGASRIGTSSGVNIVENWDETASVDAKY